MPILSLIFDVLSGRSFGGGLNGQVMAVIGWVVTMTLAALVIAALRGVLAA